MLDSLCGVYRYTSCSDQHVSTGSGVSWVTLNPGLVFTRHVTLAKLFLSVLQFSYLLSGDKE